MKSTSPASNRRRISARTMVAFGLWIVIVAGGTIGMTRYSNTPGNSGQAPIVWPTESKIHFDTEKPTLIFFAHPHCPCTRSSLGELGVLLAEFPGQINAHAVFLKPAGLPEAWDETDLWRTAKAMPDVTVEIDKGGAEAKRFDAETSGETLMYAGSGVLLFEGGITMGRGHAGDNPGRGALEAILREGHSNVANTPVFGCPLFDDSNKLGEMVCKP